MKKLLLVALFVAVPALVLAQANPSTTAPAKTEVKKIESTTTSTTTTPAKTPEAARAATTTKTTETVKTATTTTTTPEMVLIGEITNVDNANKSFTLKVKETNKEEKISFKETNPNLKHGLKIKAVYEKDASGKYWLKRYEETK